ncbi:MAG: indolepyruvate oxidoreductase subunit beta [Synergistaceae bacterium]|jgi:indolepyruvate ferredoxin oxidoreductase beta subunit|nr:indolepyruvate oxidoreductase subunit beta [Synergistaceae bacterium]
MTKSILLVGVGGQGTITASKLLTIGLLESGYDVKMNEIHGMSQRGGSVSADVRYSEAGKVAAPVISRGEADILVSFEEMETLRWTDYVKPDGAIVVSTERIDSMPVMTGRLDYPDNVLAELQNAVKTLIVIDGPAEAAKIGNSKVTNVILLGAIIRHMKLENTDWHKIIRENVKPAFIDLNLQALELGKTLMKG